MYRATIEQHETLSPNLASTEDVMPAQCTPCQSDCSLGLGPDRSECRECKASQARPTESEQVAEQQKDAADLLTKHRTTPDLLRKSLYGKRSKQADKETAAVTQLEAYQAQVTNIGEACTTTGRAPAVLLHPSLACRAAETTARGASTTHQNVQRSLNSSRTQELETTTVPTTM